MTLLYLVRHGNTFDAGEAPRRIGIRTDLPLTGAGRDQAQRLAEDFAGIRFKRAFAGKLRRTRETAALILGAQSGAPPLEHLPILDEIDHGPDENQTEDTVLARIGGPALDAWEQRLEPPPGWDAGLDWRRQGWAAALATLIETPEEPVLAVTSNGAARLALLCLGAATPAAETKLRTGSYGVVRLGKEGIDEVLEWDVRP
jgi:broad specificity phosphatase PhoE